MGEKKHMEVKKNSLDVKESFHLNILKLFFCVHSYKIFNSDKCISVENTAR